MKNLTLIPTLIAALMLSACDPEAVANRGFSLPEGDIETGQQLFQELRCIACHTVAGNDPDDEQWLIEGEREIDVLIGGESIRVQTYGDLVTSIINPSHRLAKDYSAEEVSVAGESKMPNYNGVMRVDELIDIVTFLKSRYVLKQPPITTYPIYMYH
ncbi:MAG: c-type cytochrome [Pseudomonadota bacterium]